MYVSDKHNYSFQHLLLGRLADTVANDAKTRERIFNIADISEFVPINNFHDLDGKVTVWLQLSDTCLKKLDVFLENIVKANKDLTANSPTIIG